MAQTATQWLRKEVSKLGTRSRFYHDVMELIDKAEKQEKGQIGIAYCDGYYDAEGQGLISIATQEQYYNETYQTQAQ
jgi:hypothetical protein